MRFNLNFGQLIRYQDPGDKNKIRNEEIINVFEQDFPHTVWEPIPKYIDAGIYYYLIGFAPMYGRFLQILIKYEEEEIYFLQVRIAKDLQVITEDFFRKM